MVGTARCAVRAPSGRNVFRRLYRRGSRSAGQRAVPTWFKQRKHRPYRDWDGHIDCNRPVETT